jgi:hypothetical protein
VFIGIRSQTWSNKEIVYDLRMVIDGREETKMICMAVAIELASYNIRISISKSVKSH